MVRTTQGNAVEQRKHFIYLLLCTGTDNLPAGRTELLLVTEFQTIENFQSHFPWVPEEHLRTR